MGAGEGKAFKCASRTPLAGNEVLARWRAAEDFHGDLVVGDGVTDGDEFLRAREVDAEVFAREFGQSEAVVDFDVWKFPESLINDAGWPLANEVTATALEDKRSDAAFHG